MSNHSFFVPNDDEGKVFLKQLKKHLRPSPFKVKLRGRGPRGGGDRYRSLLPLRLATHVAVYIERKPNTTWKQVVDLSAPGGTRSVQVPTKWHPQYEKLKDKA